MTNRWNNFRIKDTSQDPDIWFNELFNLNLKLKDIKAKYDKYADHLKAQVFDILPEDYKPVKVSRNVNISKMALTYLKKDACYPWNTELNRNKKQYKPYP